MRKIKLFSLLHLLLMLYSSGGIFSKLAGAEPFLSWGFCIFYGIVIVLLGIYAIGWQQIIKRMPLTTAFANKAVTIVWGLVWGIVFYQEALTPGKLIGCLLVMSGVVLFAKSDKEADYGK